MISGLGSVVKGASIGATIFGGLALKSGLDRLTTIQNATASLTTILGDAGKAGELMGKIKETVNGTPFNLDQFADVGKNLVAMNVPAAKVPGYLTAIGEAAAVSGKGAEGVSSVADAFGKMAAQGKVSLDQVWSISDTGVPALQILANGFGVTTTEMQKMISKGSVPAAKAMDILRDGIVNGSKGAAGATIALGGSMAALRQTFDGSFGGMKAAVARFGAAMLGPFMPLITSAMTGLAGLADRVAPKFQAMATKVAAAISGVSAILFQGNFTAAFGQAFGIEEDSKVVDWLFNVREGFIRLSDGVRGTFDILIKGDFTGAFARAFNVEEDAPIVDKLFRIREAIIGTFDLVAKGDFTGNFARAFNVEEDAPIVDNILNIRDSVLKFADSLKNLDISSFSSGLDSLRGTAGPVGDTLTAIKASTDGMSANFSGVGGAVAGLGTAFADMGSGSGQIAKNLIDVLAGSLGFFADHTTLATAAILAMTAGFVAQGPIADAYKVAMIIRTPLIAAQTLASFLNASASATLTAAMNANTVAQGGNTAANEKGLFARIAATTWEYAKSAAMLAGAAAAGIATGAQWLFNAALNANPIALIIIGIAALVAGLVWFFTQTDIGRGIVTAAWDAIKGAAAATVDWFTGTAWPMLQAVWDGISAGAMWLWTNVMQPVWAGISAAFDTAVGFISAAWNNVLFPIFELIGAIALYLWNGILAVAFAGIQLAWGLMVDGVNWYWTNVLSPVFTAVGDLANWLWNDVLTPAWNGILTGWNSLVNAMKWAWDNVLSPVFDAISTAATWLWNNGIKPNLDALAAAWDLLLRGMNTVWTGVLSPAFDAIGTAVGSLKGVFDTGVSGIGTAWDKLKDIAKAPIKFVVEKVINEALIGNFNKLADVFDTTHIPTLTLPEGFATGGPIPGYSPTSTADNVPVMATAGEYMQPVKTVDHYGIDVMERMRRREIPREQLQYLAGGGEVTWPAMWDIAQGLYPGVVKTSTVRPGDSGYHGKGEALDMSFPGNPVGKLNELSRRIGGAYANSTELINMGGVNIKNGRNVGDGFSTYGAVTMGQHNNHVHWANDRSPGLNKGGLSGVIARGADALGNAWDTVTGGLDPVQWIKNAATSVMDQVANNPFAQLVKAVPSKLLDMAMSKIGLGVASSGGSGPGGDVQRWAPTVERVLRELGQPLSGVAGILNVISKESGGNPTAINLTDINAQQGHPSQGLMQTIPTTFAANAGPYVGLGITNPLANIYAGVHYALAKYGPGFISGGGRKDARGGYLGYDQGGILPPGLSSVYNATGKPEVILNSAQTSALTALASQGASAPIVHVYIGDEEITSIVRVVVDESARASTVQAMAMGVRG